MKDETPQTSARTIRVAAVQMESKSGDKAANFSKIEWFVKQAAAKGVKLIAFPECCITGYWFIRNLTPEGLKNLAEPIFDGESSRGLIGMSQKYQLTIGAGLVEAAEN